MMTIYGFYQNRLWPLVHVLVNSKTKEAYNLLFNNLKTQMKNRKLKCKSEKVKVDFEAGMHAALYNNFPSVIILGCYLQKDH